jgi:hypothetical protein
MPLWDAATLTRFSQEAEDIFAREFPCIIDRIALDIIADTHTYTLSDYIIDIRKITWKGVRIDPLFHRSFREYQPSLTSRGKPTDYIFNNIGQSQIRFFPIPTESIATINTDLWGAEIANRVIVEYYRTPNYTTFTIPTFFRRRLIKAYVLRQCFAIEGKGKNLKAVKYWDNKWNNLKEIYGLLLEELINQPRRLIVGTTSRTSNFILPRPQLPEAYRNIGVDKGE